MGVHFLPSIRSLLQLHPSSIGRELVHVRHLIQMHRGGIYHGLREGKVGKITTKAGLLNLAGLFVLDNNRVGIGKQDPIYPLDIEGFNNPSFEALHNTSNTFVSAC